MRCSLVASVWLRSLRTCDSFGHAAVSCSRKLKVQNCSLSSSSCASRDRQPNPSRTAASLSSASTNVYDPPLWLCLRLGPTCGVMSGRKLMPGGMGDDLSCLSSQSAHLCVKLCILASSLMTIVLDMTLPMVHASSSCFLIAHRLWFWQARRAANSAVTCMAHWAARPRWWSASSRSSACTAATLAGPVTGVSLSTRRRDHVSVEWVSGRVFRALPASRARCVESVLVRSVCVGVLLLLSTDLEAFESQARGLVDRWQIYFGARCCLRQSIVDVCSGTPYTRQTADTC